MNVSGFRYSRQIEFQEELMNFLTTWLFLAVIKTLRGGGGGSGLKFFFSALRASVWSKSNGGGGVGRSPGPLPWIRHWSRLCPNKQRLKHVWNTLLKRDWTVFFCSQWLNNVSQVNTLSVGLFACTFNLILKYLPKLSYPKSKISNQKYPSIIFFTWNPEYSPWRRRLV